MAEMKQESIKRNWVPFIGCYVVIFYFLGPVLRGYSAGAIGETIGYLLIPFVVGATFVKKAKTTHGAYVTHTIHAIILLILVINDFFKQVDNAHAAIANGCEKNQMIENSQVNDPATIQTFTSYCTCIADELTNDVMFSVMLSGLALKEPKALTEDPEMMSKARSAAFLCQQKLGIS